MLFDLAHVPYWIFMGVGAVLFLLIIVAGGDDSDFDLDADVDLELDFDLDLDADVDADVDADLDSETDFNAAPSPVLQVLAWLGFGKAPLMLLLAIDLSSWGIAGWMLSYVWGQTFGAIPRGFLGSVVMVFSLSIALTIGGALSRPLGAIFAEFSEDSSSDRLIGCTGTVSSATIPKRGDGKIGQIDAIDPASNRVTIVAVRPDWSDCELRCGDEAILIANLDSQYLAVRKDSSDWQQWLSRSLKRR